MTTQQMYKEIAGIIKTYVDFYKSNHPKRIILSLLKDIANDLADYFEREDDGKFDSKDGLYHQQFNRQQFLEWCGLK